MCSLSPSRSEQIHRSVNNITAASVHRGRRQVSHLRIHSRTPAEQDRLVKPNCRCQKTKGI